MYDVEKKTMHESQISRRLVLLGMLATASSAFGVGYATIASPARADEADEFAETLAKGLPLSGQQGKDLAALYFERHETRAVVEHKLEELLARPGIGPTSEESWTSVDPQTVLARIYRHIRTEYDEGLFLYVDGWMFSRTEIRLLSYIASSH